MADRMSFSPVTDGRTLPRDPFAPDASPLSADIPLLIGNTQWEYIFQYGQEDPDNFTLTWERLPSRLAAAMQGIAIPGVASDVQSLTIVACIRPTAPRTYSSRSSATDVRSSMRSAWPNVKRARRARVHVSTHVEYARRRR